MAPCKRPTDHPRVTVRGRRGAVPLTPERNPTAQVPVDDEPTVIDASPEE